MRNILLMVAVCSVTLMAGCSRQGTTPLSQAEQHFRQSEWDETIQVCDEIIRKDPKNWEVYVLRGRAYLGKGDQQQAIADYTSAIEFAPKESDPLYHRSIAYKQIGKFEQAKADKALARQLDPLYASAHQNTFQDRSLPPRVWSDDPDESRKITSKPNQTPTPPAEQRRETVNQDNEIGRTLPNTNIGELIQSVRSPDPNDVINGYSSPNGLAPGESSGLLNSWLARPTGTMATETAPDQNLLQDALPAYPELGNSSPGPNGPLRGGPQQRHLPRLGGAYTTHPPMPYSPGGSPVGTPGAMPRGADPRVSSSYAQLPSSGLNTTSQQRTVYRPFDPFAARRPRLSEAGGTLGPGGVPSTGRTIMTPPSWQYRVPYPQQARPTGIDSNRGY